MNCCTCTKINDFSWVAQEVMLTCLNVRPCKCMMGAVSCAGFLTWCMYASFTTRSLDKQQKRKSALPNKSALLAPKMLLAVFRVSSRVFLPELSSLMACRKTLKLSLDSRCLHQMAQRVNAGSEQALCTWCSCGFASKPYQQCRCNFLLHLNHRLDA